MAYTSGRLESHHVADGFDCGYPDLNGWLSKDALRLQGADLARTYVWTEAGSAQVVGYFAITPSRVVRDEEGLSRTACGGPELVPCLLIAKLALDQGLHGDGLGAELLRDAVERVVGVAEMGAGRLIVVDAIDDRAANFYKRYDFIPMPKNPRRLYMKVASARKAMGL